MRCAPRCSCCLVACGELQARPHACLEAHRDRVAAAAVDLRPPRRDGPVARLGGDDHRARAGPGVGERAAGRELVRRGSVPARREPQGHRRPELLHGDEPDRARRLPGRVGRHRDQRVAAHVRSTRPIAARIRSREVLADQPVLVEELHLGHATVVRRGHGERLRRLAAERGGRGRGVPHHNRWPVVEPGRPGNRGGLHVLARRRDRVECVGDHGVRAAEAADAIRVSVTSVDRVDAVAAEDRVRSQESVDARRPGADDELVRGVAPGHRNGTGRGVRRGEDVLDVSEDVRGLARCAVVGHAVDRDADRRARVEVEPVEPRAAAEHVGPAAIAQIVIAVAAADAIGAHSAADVVIAGPAIDDVVTRVAGQGVVALPAVERVSESAPFERVAAVAAEHRRRHGQRGVDRDRVVARAEVEHEDGRRAGEVRWVGRETPIRDVVWADDVSVVDDEMQCSGRPREGEAVRRRTGGGEGQGAVDQRQARCGRWRGLNEKGDHGGREQGAPHGADGIPNPAERCGNAQCGC